eukprot:CAMPEP_0117428944 /NCGR_PEP_ID=MMETSP0758-20121206/8544_1 /TAXON_ID=63605 /ORGANISM="Percolomonas cosmopolitus, Strain AE-1 (ATCC 50343)" /LENGTH=481 /DNA_ID=CAMNT_0005215591 /DNA_START=394 /DNA_END=1836 /DNA_ORIENTATION=-
MFKRAIKIPLINQNDIFNLYEAWERKNLSQDLILLKRELDYASKNNTIAMKQLAIKQKARKDLLLTTLATPYSGTNREKIQYRLWMKYIFVENKYKIKDENNNAFRLETDDTKLSYESQLSYGIEQAISVLYHYPHIWITASKYYEHLPDVSMNYLIRGTKALPQSLLLRFALIDKHLQMGKQKDMDDHVRLVKKIYKKMIVDLPCPLVFINYMRFLYHYDSIDAMRLCFVECVSSPQASFNVFLAAAEIESMNAYKGLNHDVPFRIYQLGFKKYKKQINYVTSYVDFLKQTDAKQELKSIFREILNLHGSSQEIRFQHLQFQCNNDTMDDNTYNQLVRRFHLSKYRPSAYLYFLNEKYSFHSLKPATSRSLSVLEKTPNVVLPVSNMVLPDIDNLLSLLPSTVSTYHPSQPAPKTDSLPEAMAEVMKHMPQMMDYKMPPIDRIRNSLHRSFSNTSSNRRTYSQGFPNSRHHDNFRPSRRP